MILLLVDGSKNKMIKSKRFNSGEQVTRTELMKKLAAKYQVWHTEKAMVFFVIAMEMVTVWSIIKDE